MLWIDKILQTIWGTYHTMVYYANEKGSKILPNWVALYILHQISGILTIKSLHWTSNPTKGNVIVGIHYFFFSFISLIGILPIGLICFQYLKLQYWPSNFTLDCRETSKEWATYRNDHLPTDRGFQELQEMQLQSDASTWIWNWKWEKGCGCGCGGFCCCCCCCCSGDGIVVQFWVCNETAGKFQWRISMR